MSASQRPKDDTQDLDTSRTSHSRQASYIALPKSEHLIQTMYERLVFSASISINVIQLRYGFRKRDEGIEQVPFVGVFRLVALNWGEVVAELLECKFGPSYWFL